MRLVSISIFAFFTSFYGLCQETVISGKIDKKTLIAMGGALSIDCYTPYNSIAYNEQIPTKIELDSLLGTFTWNIPIQDPIFVTIGALGQKVSIYLEAGWHTSVLLSTNQFGRLIASIQENGKVENDVLSDIISKEHFRTIDRYLEEQIDSLPLPELISGYRELLVQNTLPIDSLFSNNLIGKKFYDIGTKRIKGLNLFLGTSKLLELYELSKDTIRKEKAKAILTASSDWFDIDNSVWIKVPMWPIVFTAYTIIRDITENDIILKQPYSVWNIHDRNVYLPEPARELNLFVLLITEFQRKSGEFDFKEAYSFFRAHYPISKYSVYLEEAVRKELTEKQLAILYDGRLKPSTDNQLSFIVDYNNGADTLDVNEIMLTDFNELITAVQDGNPVYIDFWATWCTPCKQEFPHSVARHNDFKKAGVLPVYVSIDDPALYNRWSRSISEYKLEGRHVLVSKALYKKLQEEIGLRTIPRYMFVDSNGNILDADATRPSDTQGIKNSLEEIVKIR